MRPIRAATLLTAGLVTLLGVPGAAAAAETPSDLYVNHTADAHCSDAGTGTQAVPFCTIGAAARIVAPGQTVRITPSDRYDGYDENLTIDRSGTPSKPISFLGEGVLLGWDNSLTIKGASHVVVRGLQIDSNLRVSGSTDVELDRMHISTTGFSVTVADGSENVRVTRSTLSGVRIEGGSQRTVVGRNAIAGRHDEVSASVQDAPGTAITNNTLHGDCGSRITVDGNSTGSAVFNNVIHSHTYTTCAQDQPRAAIAVSPSAAPGVRSDYNLITHNSSDQVSAYKWAGSAYTTAAAFQAATGQGAHDLVTPPGTDVDSWKDSPAIDSGDPTAPGVLPTDYGQRPIADDPSIPNTGKDGGYIDRGARETQDRLEGVSLQLDQSWAPAGTTVKATAVPNALWPAGLTYHFDFGDGTAPVVTKAVTAEHVFKTSCECTVKVTAVNGVGEKVFAGSSARVTDPAPLMARFTATSELPHSTDPFGGTRPLSVSVDSSGTVTPWPVAGVDVDFGDGKSEHTSDLSRLSHAYGLPGEYKITVTVRDTRGGTSSASQKVRVDYAPSGYVTVEPFRVLDSRATRAPVQSNYDYWVDLPVGAKLPGHPLSGSMASAVLNVTLTDATEDGHLTVWPSGQSRPATSSLNIKAGGTSSNTVTVPVGPDGRVQARLNTGRAALIVDFVGYYQPNAGQKFSPVAPTRLADTRTAGGALGGGTTRTVKVAGVHGIPADATAVAVNLTSTGATENTHVIAYPDPAKRPTTSNLNPEPGKDKSNQAILPVGPDGTVTLYNNAGSTHLIVDGVGYYGKDGKALFTPVVPQRLADTRTTGKLAPGATTTVSGLPAGAVGAVLNLTATETTAAGFLTAYGFGSARPQASSLSALPGLTVPNHVTTPVGDGKVSVGNSWGGPNHVITDLLGYFSQG
ncbi:PKD domain-containing protein [Streptomyces sp. NRRL F-4474]|uniref:PKD domain-containing protein n=1 Tax=Streptomyces sp. NRRL F-4474 TaxID=1463851 RepID=UPI0004C6B689|nr:PKD domain-containing protein [Streptomyces sp. NRRL F-4474]